MLRIRNNKTWIRILGQHFTDSDPDPNYTNNVQTKRSKLKTPTSL